MEYIIFIAAAAAFLLVIFVREWYQNAKEEKKFIKKLQENYCELNHKTYSPERYVRMGSYFERHLKSGQIDDITWDDLSMDDVFKRMNYTLSASGEEFLYYTLRTPLRDREAIRRMEELTEYFGANPEARIRTQLTLRKLGYMGKYSLYDYMDNLDYLGERSNLKNIICDLLFIPLIGMLWVNFSLAIMGIVVLIIYNIVTYFAEKSDIDPYITSFAYVIRLMEVCDELEKHPVPVCTQEWENMKKHKRALQGIRRNSFWVMSATRGNSSGDIISMFLDYVRMIFHVDLMKFNGMLKGLRGHIEDVDALIGIVGYLETVISVWIYRQSLNGDYCIPEFTEEEYLEMQDGYHPLLSNPVKNSITAKKGVLLTGSNASGKSTFLKTVALNALLAQTVNTCLAKRYAGAFFYIYSSMSLRDNIGGGESYYIVEIKSLKRILDAAAAGERPVLCFVDEVLRGTNTVERIAASTQILKSLGASDILCFAATHDIELTDLLAADYDNYHFEEDVRDGDVYFHYRLLQGKATTRNAIKLLELMGYDAALIEQASARAERFLDTGAWT